MSRVAGLSAVVAIAYIASAQTGFAFAFATDQVTAVWPPTGLAVASLLLGGRRLWPGVLVGAFVANLASDEPVVTAAAIAVGNTLEAVVGAWLVSRVAGFRPALDRTRDVLALVAYAGFVSTTISATIGVTALWASGIVESAAVGSVWRVWWLGDAGGTLLVAPVILVIGTLLREQGTRATATLAKSLLASAGLVGFGWWFVFRTSEPIAYLLFPVMFAIALRLRQPGTTLASLSLASVAVYATSHGYGQFAGADPDIAMLRAQTFVGVLAVTGLLLTAFRTERQAAENAERAQRQLSQELAAASAAKSRFLANVSHELRTPIHVIGGFAATLLTDRSGPLNDGQRTQVEAIHRSGMHLNGLINDLLDLARSEAADRSEAPLAIEPIDCTELLHDVAAELTQLASDKGLHLRVDAPPALAAEADRRALRQILINLSGNAIKFTSTGDVTLAGRRTVDGAVRLSVTDAGLGIAPEDQDRMFDAFEQGAGSHEGLGLGLHISRTLATRLGAQLDLSSTQGQGSTFTVTLAAAGTR